MKIIPSFFSTSGKALTTKPVAKRTTLVIPEDSMLRRHFLVQLRTEIETVLIPDQNDQSLRHYYEACVAAEYQKRLSEMTE